MMNYTCSTNINKPLDEVIHKFMDPESLKHWQPGFISYEPLSGEPGQKGSTSKFTFMMGKKQMELIETILENKLPNEFSISFSAKGMSNIVTSYFKPIDDHTTLYECYNEFQMKGFMKIIGWLMPGAFKKQSMVYLNNFKAYVEEGKSILTTQ